MARIVLNTLIDAGSYPVDVSELRLLSTTNLALTNSFRQWAFSNSLFRFNQGTTDRLGELAASHPQVTAAHP